MDLLEGQVVAATVPSTTGSSDHLMGAWDTWLELQCRSPSGRRGICSHHAGGRSAPPNQRIRPCWSEASAPPHTAIPATTPSRPRGSSGAWPPSPGAGVQLLPARPLPRAVPSDRRGSQEGLLTVTRPPSGADSPPGSRPPSSGGLCLGGKHVRTASSRPTTHPPGPDAPAQPLPGLWGHTVGRGRGAVPTFRPSPRISSQVCEAAA